MNTKREKKKIIKHLSISNCERDFIQFMFCENRVLLGYKYKELYKAMFEAYQDIWNQGRKRKIDLGMINKAFIANL